MQYTEKSVHFEKVTTVYANGNIKPKDRKDIKSIFRIEMKNVD